MAFENQQLLGNDSAMRVDVLAQLALEELREGLQFLGNTNRGFDAQKEGDAYKTTVITGEKSSIRAPGAEVTDSDNTTSQVTIPVDEHVYPVLWDPSSYRGQPGNFWQQFISNGAKALSEGIETAALAAAANDPAITQLNNTSAGTMQFADFEDAAETLNKSRAAKGDRVMVMSHGSLKSALQETEFSEYNTSGIAGILSRGNSDNVPMYGFMPFHSDLVYNGSLLGVDNAAVCQLAGALGDTTTTSVPVDVVDPAGNLAPGDVIEIDTEKMIIVSLSSPSPDTTPPTFTSVTLEVQRGALGSTAATHADNAVAAKVSGYCNLAFSKSNAIHIFAPQDPPSGMAPAGFDKGKATSPDGIELYVQREVVPNRNGAIRYTMSAVFGFKFLRPEAVVKVLTTT